MSIDAKTLAKLENLINRVAAVYYDSASPYAGVIIPVGTRTFPVNNIPDLEGILSARGLKVVVLLSNITFIDGGLTGIHFTSEKEGPDHSAPVVNLNGQDANGCSFSNLFVQGWSPGAALHLTKCFVGSLDCHAMYIFKGVIGDGGGTLLKAPFIDIDDCYFDSDTDIDGDGGQIQIGRSSAMAGNDIHILNLTFWVKRSTIELSGGRISIEVTCTAGELRIFGNCDLLNLSGGITILDHRKLPLQVKEVTIYPLGTEIGLEELTGLDNNLAAYYSAMVTNTASNDENNPGVAWVGFFNLEESGLYDALEVLYMYLFVEWQTQWVFVAGGDGTHSISKIQLSADNGATWVDVTDNFSNNLGGVMTPRGRSGLGLWLPFLYVGPAGVPARIGIRLAHWTDDSGTGAHMCESAAQIRGTTYIRMVYRKAAHEIP